MRDLRIAPPETLLAVTEIVAPRGPAPYHRSRFLQAVKDGQAPQPVMREPRCTRWRWGDIRAWLDDLADRRG